MSLLRYSILILMIGILPSLGASTCSTEILNEEMGIHLVVENCSSVGTFSLGGLYQGEWKKLLYHYPKPWDGTFLSIVLENRTYSTSPRTEAIFLDNFLRKSYLDGNSVIAEWTLPEGLLVKQILTVEKNSLKITIELTNMGGTPIQPGIRLHLDTMLGDNDGAPIYIPGDGLKRNEQDYPSPNFGYWKAYNREVNPTIVSTGTLLGEGLSYPDRLIVTNWKRSVHSSWNYNSGNKSILGDSAVILYYGKRSIAPGESRTLSTSYGSGEPILPVEKGTFGIAEITPDKILGIYCPEDLARLNVDIISAETPNQGMVKMEIRDKKGNLIQRDVKNTGIVEKHSIKTLEFEYKMEKDGLYMAKATLYRDEKSVGEKSIQLKVDPSQCAPKARGLNWTFLFILIAFILIAITFLLYREFWQGRVEIEKIKEGNLVKVIVRNSTREALKNCRIEDKVVKGAEVHISTIGVRRKGNKLTWNLGKLPAREKAVLEYTIKGAEVLPKAKVSWSEGELESG